MCSCKRGTSNTVTVSTPQPKQPESSKTSVNSPTIPNSK